MSPTEPASALGARITYYRRIAPMTQQQLADAAGVHVGTVRKIERGARGASDAVTEALAAALGVDPGRLAGIRDRADARVHAAMPALSAVLATYDTPEDGPVRPLPRLRSAVNEAVGWRLAAQYVPIAREVPDLLGELACAVQLGGAARRAEAAMLMAVAVRAADAVAYKYGALDLWPSPRPEPGGGVFWKTPTITAWADGRAFAWIDDEITDADRAWVAAHHRGPALLRRVDPRVGLRADDFAALARWAADLDRPWGRCQRGT